MSGQTQSQLPPPQRATREVRPAPLPATEPQRVKGLRDASTPQVLRRLAVLLVVLTAATAFVGFGVAANVVDTTERIRDNTGPVLVAAQNLRSSLAEADAAATAAFLSQQDVSSGGAGSTAGEDPRQRRAYLDALERATAQLEDVAARIGDDPTAHDALRDIGRDVTRYAALVEAARATRAVGDDGAEVYLLDAVQLLNDEIAADFDRLSTATQERLNDDLGEQTSSLLLALIVAGITLVLLALAQRVTFRRTRRILNPGLVVATLAVVAAAGWLGIAIDSSNATVKQARFDGYDAIALTNDLQANAFASKGAATIAVITGDEDAAAEALEQVRELYELHVTDETLDAARTGGVEGGGLIAELVFEADSPREFAQAAETLERFRRYRSEIDAVLNLPEAQAAERIAGPVASEFNGLNFTIEGVLAANRDQFLGGLADARGRLSWLPQAALVLPLLAAIAAWLGLKSRIDEYR